MTRFSTGMAALVLAILGQAAYATDDGDTPETVILTRGGLIAQMETAGKNDGPDEIHAVNMTDCTLTTYRWKKQPDGSRKLWNSFRFDITQVATVTPIGSPSANADDENELGLVQFEMRAPAMARFEKPVERKVKRQNLPSPRKDQGDYYYDTAGRFFFMHIGAGAATKARTFVSAFEEYRLQYCYFAG